MLVTDTVLRLVKSCGCHGYCGTGLSRHIVVMDSGTSLSSRVVMDTVVQLVKPCGCHGYCGKACQVIWLV